MWRSWSVGCGLRSATDERRAKPVGEYNYLVRVKTSITLPSDLLKSIDHVDSNRSAFIEHATRAYLTRLARAKRDARDVEIINANADRLNEEAMDVLEYQGLP